MSTELIFALACGLGALVYGGLSVKWILAKPTGNDRMREISGAIQEGASAYLNRQYTTIGIAGIALLLVIGVFIDWTTAAGFGVGAVFTGLAGDGVADVCELLSIGSAVAAGIVSNAA